MISDAHRSNLETLQRAFDNGDAALVECQRVADGETVVTLCAVGRDGEEYVITPFAEMVGGNPFDLYRPPNPDGGFGGATAPEARV
jgi:hypothetical protein